MALPQHFMDELRRRSSLSGVIGRHVKLTKRGNRFIGLCPFHNEKTPSFHVSEDDGYYHCFGCGVSGDAISFLREKEGLGFMDAVRNLADLAGMDVPQSTPQDPEVTEKRKKSLDILDQSARQFQSALMAGDNPAAAYLKKRGIDQSAVETFRLGFAPRSGLAEALGRFGHKPDEIIESGMMRISDRDQSRYEMFRHRLMFPITDNRGQVIAFGARALSDDQQPKYLNSAESPIFQKKQVLYGMALARVAVRQGLPLVVCEGYMDVIAVHQSGLAAAVAPLGTALTEEQIKLLWRMDDQPILCFDGDAAGKAAALKALIRSIPLLEPGKTLRLAMLPPGVDPDDLIKAQGNDAFSALLNSTVSWMDGLWDGLAAGYQLDDVSQRAAFWQDIRGHLKQITNGQMRASIGDEVERRISAMRQAVREERYGGRYTSLRYNSTERPNVQQDARSRVIMALLIDHPSLVHDFYEQISLLRFHDEKMEKLRQTVINIVSIRSDLDDDGFRHHLNEYGYKNIKGVALLKGMEARIRFDPVSLGVEQARLRLSEVIKLETRQKAVKPRLKRPNSDMMG
ncbi:MAG: DNA primase [Alphaproteobacteria bacterium]|nr:DNA primase [Alphaproteobacteria bacterium]